MSCEICGRGSCCRSFHSQSDQARFDAKADGMVDEIKEEIKDKVTSGLDDLDYADIDGTNWIKLDSALDMVREID